MKSLRDIYRRTIALVLFVFITTSTMFAQFNPFDPLNLTSVIGGVQVNGNGISFQPPHFDQIPQFLQALPQQAALPFLNPVGSALALAIRQARQNVRSQGCGPAPRSVVSELSPFMPSAVFDGVCWATLRQGMGIDNLVIEAGGMTAVTFDDTIVFRDAESGFDPVIWAHELTHVLQYRRLSVEGFANIYSYDSGRLEGEAYGFQNFVSARINIQPGSDWWRPQYYDAENGWNSNSPMTGAMWSEQARAAIRPETCMNVKGTVWAGGTAVQVFNNCPITVLVTSFVDRNVQTGELCERPCVGNCVVQSSLAVPGVYSAFPTPLGFVNQGVNMQWF